MKKMLSKVLALTLVVALGLGLTGGAFAAEPQTGTFDLESTCYDYGQAITKVVITLDQPVGEVTEEEVVAAFSVMVLGCDYNSWGTVITGDNPRTITGATVSEDGLTITLELDGSFAESTLGGTVMYNNNSTGYGVTLTENLGNLTTDLALTFGKLYDPVADKWAAVPLSNEKLTYAYRWYDPAKDGYEMPEGGYPIIVWIHGAGEWGSDNNAQLTANRVTAWGEAETQDIFGGAYVIAPQAYRGEETVDPTLTGWNGDNIKNTVEDLIATVGEENVNRNDIVIGGCSAGGAGTWTAILANPDYYAAAFPICPASSQSQLTEANLELLDMPIYLTHSIDDTTVNVSTSITSYNTLKAAGKTNIYLGLFEHVAGNGVPEEVASFLGHWSWMYNHNNFDGTEQWWLEEYLHTDEVTYETTTPAELGYETFKHWLAAQVLEDTYYTRDRDVVAYGETINGITVYNLPNRVKATETVADYLAANPIVVTVIGGGTDEEGNPIDVVREPVDVIVGEDRTSLTLVFELADFIAPLGSVTAPYVVTVGGEEIQYRGDEADTADFASVTYTTPEYVRGGQTLTSMSSRYFVPDKEAYPAPEDGYALVVWLHGGGETGTDNRKPVAANDVHAWTEAPSQDIFGGAYVLAPQNHASAGLGAPAATMSVIEQFIAEMGDIDVDRIYVGGCSYGGIGTWEMLRNYPYFFAAGFPICCGPTGGLTTVEAAALSNTPIYMVTSTGDSSGIVSGMMNAYNALVAAGSEVVHFAMFEHSEFPGQDTFVASVGEGVLDHWSWVYVHEDFDATGDDYDGKNFVDSTVDGTYNDGKVVVADGILTYTYESGTDEEGNPVTTSVSLNGKTERPADLGVETFKTWLAAQVKADEYLTLNHSVASYGETISGITVTLAEPLTELGEVKVEATAMVMDLTTFANVETTGEIPVKSATLSDDGLTVEIDLGINTMWTLASSNAYMDVTVTIGDKVITDVQGETSDVDVFEALTFTVPEYSWGTTMEARAFTPDKETYPAPENGYPLIVWLHGGGEIGTDNRIQVAANDVPQWTEKETQDLFGGAYVLAPQNHVGGNTGAGAAATMDVILQFIEMKGDIDVTKIYVGGCSYGGMSTWGIIRQYPNFFAAAFPICGVTSFAEGEAEALAASDMPIYMIHSVDDNTVSITGSTNAYTALVEAGKENVYLALFSQIEAEGIPAEAAGFLGHWSWVYAHDDFDASEQYWLETFELTDEEGNVLGTYETTTPAELGATSFKAWLAAQVNPTPSYFKDVTGETENYDAIIALFEMGVTNGTGNYEYEPDATLTRAEFMTFLARAVEATVDNTADTGFTDVAVNSWETGSIAWGVGLGLIEGYGDGTFGPEDPVTEEQVNLIIGRLLENESNLTAADGQTIADATAEPATRGQVAGVIKAVADNYTAPSGWWW